MKKLIVIFVFVGMIVILSIKGYSIDNIESDIVVVADSSVTVDDPNSVDESVDATLSYDEMVEHVRPESQPERMSKGLYDELYDTNNVQLIPQFPGGEAAMYQWIFSHIKYPKSAAEKGVKGRVIVWFIVECDGSITNVKVLRGKDPALDEEAIRVVSSMPKWNPGRLYDKPVRVEYLLPVTFIL